MPAKVAKKTKAKSSSMAKASKPAKKMMSETMPFYADMQNMLVIAAVVILFIVVVMVISSMGTTMKY